MKTKTEKSWREREDEKYKVVRSKYGRSEVLRKVFARIHQSWLVVGLLGGIIIGTILAMILRIEFFSSPIWIGFVAMVFLFSFFRPNFLGIGIAVVLGSILAFVRISGDLRGQEIAKQYVGETIEVAGVVAGDVDEDGSSCALKLKDIEIDGKYVGGSIYIIYSNGEDKLQRSDRATFSGQMNEGFGSFSGSMYRAELKEISRPEPGDVFLKARNWLAGKVREYIPGDEGSLALAYLLGMKTGLPEKISSMLQIVGLTHIVVASGTHLGIITGALKKIFGKISRFAGVFFSLIFIFLFGGIIGWTASITRAIIVTSLGLITWYVGRKIEAWRAILFSMAITLLINPMFLIDVGWLLSFAAFIGIMILAPEIKKFLFGEGKFSRKIYESIAEIFVTTISATVMCAPILLYFFGSLSIISIFANILILPTIAITMGLTFFTGIFGAILPIFGIIFGKITEIIVKYHIIVMEFFSEQEIFLIKIPKGEAWVFVFYIIVGGIFFFLQRSNRKESKLEEREGRRLER